LKIELKKITIDKLVKGYEDNQDGGVVGYGGELDIRPPFQREFIYEPAERNAVIDTVKKEFPLNVMYWAVRDQGGFEIIDGQQRTIAICRYVEGKFPVEKQFFYNLEKDEKERILNYKLTIYFCSGPDSEKLEWFKTINIAGVKLTNQELRNAVYSGSWVSDAKRYFSRRDCVAHNKANRYLNGQCLRQEYLETAIRWASGASGDESIEHYMARRQREPNAKELWSYFEKVIDWTEALFPNYRREMQGVQWGELYNACKDKKFDPAALEKQVAELMEDEDVTNKKGVYSYVLTGEERRLNIRAFSNKQKRETYERQKGNCPACGKDFQLKEMEADHIKPWHEGGKTIAENCQMLCKPCNRTKSGK